MVLPNFNKCGKEKDMGGGLIIALFQKGCSLSRSESYFVFEDKESIVRPM